MKNSHENFFPLLDLTSLNETDDISSIVLLCSKAVRKSGHVAAICVYPQFVKQGVRALKNTNVKVATVANFPQGTSSVATVTAAIQESVQNGAQEIDVVFPYMSYLAGEKKSAQDFIRACKKACGETILLKVILETGALQDLKIIAEASQDTLLAGADFLKTATGKIAVGATLEVADVMLHTIKTMSVELQRPIGLKVSGGIRTEQVAMQYIKLAEERMGAEWVNPQHFRIGASRLFDEI